MGKNTNGTKELPNEKSQEVPEVSEVEESQPSQESLSEGSTSVENDKDTPKKEISVDELKPHPQNEKIYGNEDVSDLVALIKAGGIIDTLVINEKFEIISGHRRRLAAKELGFKTVPCEVKTFASPEDELLALVLYNQSREKTKEQKFRESMALEEVYASEAYKRKIANLKQNQSVMDTLAKSDEAGTTRDKVAQKAGFFSGRSHDRAKTVIKKIDELKRDGKKEDAELLASHLNKSVSGAKDLAAKIDSLSEDDKNNLKKGKAKLRDIVPKTKNEDVSTKSPSGYTLVMAQLKKIEDAITVLNKLSTLGEGDNKKQKIQEKIESQIENLQKLLQTSGSSESKEENEVET